MPPILAKPGIRRIKAHMIGAGQDGLPPIRVALNSNESAFGPAPAAQQALTDHAKGIERYFENPETLLGPAIGAWAGLDPARIVIGQGSDDLLARLARAYLGPGTELVRSATGYLKVPNYAYGNDAEAVHVAPDPGFQTSVDGLLAAVTPGTRMVYIANPENPAGTWLSGAEVRKLHAGLPEQVLLVIDGAYEDYVDDPAFEAGQVLAGEAQNVVVCRTFSKVFGLAGARVGWMFGPPDIVDPVRRLGLTFPVATPSLHAAIAAMQDAAHRSHVVTETRRLRDWLTRELTARGITVIPSQANFLLLGWPGEPGRALALTQALRAEGIALRRFANPAYDDWTRVTIGLEPELEAFLAATDRALSGAAA